MPVSSIPLVLDKATPFWQILSSRWEVKLHSGERKMLEKPTPSDFRFQNLELFSQQKTMKIHFYIFYKLLTRELTSHILKNTLDGDIVGLLKGIYIYIHLMKELKCPPPCDPCIPRFPGLRRRGDQARWPYARSSDLTNWPKASSICRVAGSFIRRCDQNHL